MGANPQSMINENMPDPQNVPTTATTPAVTVQEELDPEFLQEIENYLVECKENNEASIDMSDTLICDQGAKMVAAVAAYCEQLKEIRLS